MGTIFQTSLYAADRAAFELTNTAQCTATLLLGSTTKDLHLPCSLRAFLTLYSCSISRFTTLCAQYEKRSDHSLPRFMGKRHNHKRSRARPRHRPEETHGDVDTSSASATRYPGWQAVIQENAPTHHCSKPAPAVKPDHMGTNGLPTLTSIPCSRCGIACLVSNGQCSDTSCARGARPRWQDQQARFASFLNSRNVPQWRQTLLNTSIQQHYHVSIQNLR